MSRHKELRLARPIEGSAASQGKMTPPAIWGAFAQFEQAATRRLGDNVCMSDALAADLWSALANVIWRHADGVTVRYSFRSAGALIARIRRAGSYLDWYCCGPEGSVAPWIEEALAAEGWSWTTYDNERGI